MAFVLDASVTMSWCFPDETSRLSDSVLDRLRDTEAFVPAIWLLEVANALLVAERQSRLTHAMVRQFIGILESLGAPAPGNAR